MCPFCKKIFELELLRPKHHGFPFHLKSLVVWTKENELFVRNLVSSFKGEHSKWLWDSMIKEYLVWNRIEAKAEAVIVPSPGRSNKVDHAYWFACALGRELDLPVCDSLVLHNQKRAQKGLKRKDRTQREMRAKGELFQEVIFVDDVVTTGATARAAQKALKYPKSFTVLAFACRPMEKLV